MENAQLTYDQNKKQLMLSGHPLLDGDLIEILVFGSWIPGKVAFDSMGCYLLTLNNVGIRLRSGIVARFSPATFLGNVFPSEFQSGST